MIDKQHQGRPDLKKRQSPNTERRTTKVDPYVTALLEQIGEGQTVLHLDTGATVFSQGEPADSVYFIEDGRVQLAVVSGAGRAAVLAILGPHGFLGEGCLVGQTLRISTAVAVEPSTLIRIESRAMLQALSAQPELSESFISALLIRNIDLEGDLCDQLFNHSEKRLARALLKLAHFGYADAIPEATLPRISHETLAGMVGTTRSRVTHFMNKFRTLGLIDYDRGATGSITVRAELLTDIVLHD